MPDFLLEIGCEEIPARMIDAAAAELERRVADLLSRESLTISGTVERFSTPRRIALFVGGIPSAQKDVQEQERGPSAAVAFNNGEPTPAAHNFARKVNVPIAELQRIQPPKGEYLAANVIKKGKPASEILATSL